MKFISIIIVAFLSSSCEKTPQLQVPKEPEKENNYINAVSGSHNYDSFFPDFYNTDTLYINVRLDDCGEWGGPQENLKMFMNEKREFVLNYKHFRFNCDSIGKYYGMKNKPLDFQKTIIMDSKGKVALSDFIKASIQAKISENVSSNAGNTVHIHTADSTLNIDVYSTDYKIANDFIKLKQELGLPAKRQKPELE